MNKKSLSQNWLSDEESLEAMIRLGEVIRDDVVLEIGPGPGTLTDYLTQSAKHVVAVEFDEHLAENLTSVVDANNLEVHHQDVLKFDPGALPSGYKIVANIPYHITAKILQHFLQSTNPPSLMTLLVQKEVAERICAEPGEMSVLAVSVQLMAEADLGPIVPAELFVPVPKVDSQIVRIRLRDKPLFDVDQKKFFRIVKAGFGEKRKKLTNSLAGGLPIAKEDIETVLEKNGLDKNTRAQELSLESWYTLYSELEAHI